MLGSFPQKKNKSIATEKLIWIAYYVIADSFLNLIAVKQQILQTVISNKCARSQAFICKAQFWTQFNKNGLDTSMIHYLPANLDKHILQISSLFILISKLLLMNLALYFKLSCPSSWQLALYFSTSNQSKDILPSV